MPVILFQAACIQMCAIFGPTPGKAKSPANVSGMSPLYLSLQIAVVCLMKVDFLYKNGNQNMFNHTSLAVIYSNILKQC